MTLPRLSSSGVVGIGARTGAAPAILSSGLRLAGRALPVVSPSRVYVCGITPYDVTHLGHAATFVWADLLGSVLRMSGSEVLTSRNVTDVDDVLTRAADARGRHYDEFASSQEFAFDQDMRALSVRVPTHQPRARRHIAHVQQLAAALLAVDRAYLRDGHVYFRGAGVPAAAGVDRARAMALIVEYGDDPHDPHRDDPFDVAVWRPSAESDPAWPSPWGWGRPGWHAGCAAMAHASLGHGIDVLVGGDDLAFPHHAYQAAMVEAASGVNPFARAQMHVGGVGKGGAKMAKSTGNLTLVADLLRAHPAPVVRLLLLDRRWATPWEFEVDQIAGAARRLDDLFTAAGRPGIDGAGSAEISRRLLDDLDVPGALDVGIADGGDAARQLIGLLALG